MDAPKPGVYMDERWLTKRHKEQAETSFAYRITQAAKAGWNVPADDPDDTPEHLEDDPA